MTYNSNRQKREEALERQAAREKLTSKQQLELLDSILGVNVGALKERARLNSLIEKESAKKTKKKTNKGRKKDFSRS